MKRVEPVPAPSTPVERQTPATAVQTAKLPDLTIGEAAAPRQPAPIAAPSAAPSTPVAQPSPAPAVAQAAKLPDLKIGEAAAPPAVVVAAPSTPIAQQTPAPAAQAAKAPDLKAAATAAPQAVVVAAQAAKPADPAPAAVPVAQVPAAQTATNETLAYAALLAQGVRGPVEVRLADRATMWLPANRVYLDGEQARKLLGAGKNWDNATQGVVLPATSRPDWMAYVSLVDDGYISDQDAKAMDPEAVLGTYKAKVAAENPARARQGLSPLEVTGWMEAPRYDAKHRLSSCLGATLLGSKGPDDRIVNCSSFALGDQGALKIVVAGQEANYQRFRGESGALIDTIVYDKGKGYDDADLATVKMAPYGLIALMTGDTNFKKVTVAQPAAAPAQKLGLIALLIVYALKFGKMLLFGVAAVFAFVRWFGAQAQVRRQKAGEGTRGRRADLAARHSGGASQARVARRARPAGRRFRRRRRAGTGRGAAKDRRRRGARRRAREIAVAPAPRERARNRPPPSSAAPQGEESPATSLARLASMMRKKAPEVPVQVDLSRLERRPSSGAATAAAAAVRRSELEVVRPLPGAAPMAAPKPVAAAPAPAPRAEPAPEPMPAPSPAPALEPFALIEPGDEAAASIAISARESLREANG